MTVAIAYGVALVALAIAFASLRAQVAELAGFVRDRNLMQELLAGAQHEGHHSTPWPGGSPVQPGAVLPDPLHQAIQLGETTVVFVARVACATCETLFGDFDALRRAVSPLPLVVAAVDRPAPVPAAAFCQLSAEGMEGVPTPSVLLVDDSGVVHGVGHIRDLDDIITFGHEAREHLFAPFDDPATHR